MKKIILLIIAFFSLYSISYWYIDYRHDLKTNYFASLKYINNHIYEKQKIDNKIKILKDKIKNLTFDEKASLIENLKEKILNYLYDYHISKDNVIYYRLTYFYNELDNLKQYTNLNYQTKNYSEIYNNKIYFDYKQKNSLISYYNQIKYKYKDYNNSQTNYNTYTNKKCSLNFYWENYTLANWEFKVLTHKTNSYTITNSYKCNNWELKLIKSDSYNNS